MRCYFMRGGHIVAVEELKVASDAEAVERSAKLFAARKGDKLEGFEVWDRARFIHRFSVNGNSKASQRQSAG